jgi:hypothetical protein
MMKKGEQMKFSNIAKVGQTIRAYDFKPMVGREDCFVEGVVEVVSDNTMGYRAFKITATKDVWSGESQPKGKNSRVGKIVFVPHEVDFMEYDARIMNLSV